MAIDVEKFVRDITRPLFVYRMARGDNAPHRALSADKRRLHAEDEIRRVVDEHTGQTAYDGSNDAQKRELTARERDIVCRVLSDIISHARHSPGITDWRDLHVHIRVGEPNFIDVLREVRTVLDPRRG